MKLTAAATTVLLLAAMTGCSDGGGDDTGSGKPAVEPVTDSTTSLDSIEKARPRPGDCHTMTLKQVTATSADNTSTDCLHRPTAITVAVGELKVKGKDVEPDSAAAQDLMRRTCEPRLAKWLGADREELRLSRLTAVWFVPTPEQVQAGARWFRCDVVGFERGDNLFPLPPPNELEGVLGKDKGGRYALCGTARPGTKTFERVTCSRKHAWRALTTIDLEGGKTYPGQGKVREDGDSACSDAAGEQAGDATRYEYGWEWPSRQQWRAGQRYGFCWVPA